MFINENRMLLLRIEPQPRVSPQLVGEFLAKLSERGP
jgi:hypothetical protein